jgi:ADP-glucose pyrophosphorylase
LTRTILRKMKPGVLICSADTLEHIADDISFDPNAEVILFGHNSDIPTAENHGVYVLDNNGGLAFVLQKPSKELMTQMGALNDDGKAVTDSCYIFSSTLVDELIELRQKKEDILCEICCYGDFLRPLGSCPIAGWFPNDGSDLSKWRQSLTEIMATKKATVVNLGENTFYHLGTIPEMFEHFFSSTTTFPAKFLNNIRLNTTHSIVNGNAKIHPCSLVEWSVIGPNCVVDKHCVIR